MNLNDRVHIAYDVLARACTKWSVERISVFGSILRDDFSDTSDIDLLLQFKKEARHSLFDYQYIHDDFRKAFDREIDIVNYDGLLSSRNALRRKNILSTAQELYVAAA